MATPTRLLAARLPLLALAAVVLAFPAGAAANANNPITQTGGMTATLPLPLIGTPLTVKVSLDGVGDISGVTLDPSGALSGTSSAKDVVKFSNADGSVKVTVKASGDHMAIKAKADLAKLLGDGAWSANVFGTGDAKVAYTIGKDGNGNPTVSIGAVSAPSGVDSTKLDPKSKTSGKFAWASAGVLFSHDGFTKRLTISIGTHKTDGSARLSIVLSGRDRQKLTGTLAQLAGDRTWAAKLCTGTAVSVKYHVASDGTVVYDGADGAPASEKDVKSGWNKKDDKSKEMPSDSKHKGWGGQGLASGIIVRFDKTNVGVALFLFKNDDGTYTLRVLGHSGHCGDGKGKHHHHQGDWQGDGHRGDGRHHHRHDGDSNPKSKPKP
jgi:hypothetical protein